MTISVNLSATQLLQPNLADIVEGGETREQMDYLARLGCRKMQGYYFSRPLPAEKVEAFLQRFSRPDLCPFLLEPAKRCQIFLKS